MQDKPPILIAGPTASGKSRLALALARQFGGCVINADSMQVYRELRVLTARPTAAEEAERPHRLYGHVPASQAYSTGRYLADAAEAIDAAYAAGLRPIITGGTGLYFKALLEGLSPMPPVPEEVRAHWRAEAARLGSVALHGILAKRDPQMAARLAPADTQRVVRALEVLEASGASLAHWQMQPGTPVVAAGAIKLLVTRPRAELAARANTRFDAMLAQGALAEAAVLAALELDRGLPAMRALGVAPLIGAAGGELTLEAAAEQAKAETRLYIKRQETWFRRCMISWQHISAQEMESIAANGFPFIDVQD